MKALVSVFQETWTVNHDFVIRYGSYKSFNHQQPKDKEVLVDRHLITNHPDILPPKSKT